MRTLALVATLMIGTAAIAQDMPQQAAPSDNQPMQQMQAAPPADTGATPPADTGMTPPAAPDASGQPMTPPADASQPMTPTTPMADQGAMGATPPAGGMQGMQNVTPPPSEYPLCSRTVKDRCRNRGGK